MRRRPPRSTLFPYTTLSRSESLTGELVDPASTVDAPVRFEMRRILDPGKRRVGRSVGIDPDHVVLVGATGLLVSRAERSEEHTSELQSRQYLVCRLLLEKNK